MPYTATRPVPAPTPDELRSRVPGWGADLDPADRPAVPRERHDLESGAHWREPAQQPELTPRERSIEHERLTPVFGTAQPPKGLSGALKRLAYVRFSEGRNAHWLLLVASDRVDAIESHLASLVTARPDEPLTQSGARRAHAPRLAVARRARARRHEARLARPGDRRRAVGARGGARGRGDPSGAAALRGEAGERASPSRPRKKAASCGGCPARSWRWAGLSSLRSLRPRP